MKKNNKPLIPKLDQQIELSELLRMLLSKWLWIVLAGVVAFCAVFACTKLLVTPKYESYITLYVYNNSEISAASGAINSSDLQAAETLAGTYSVILRSNVVLDAVLDTVNAELGDAQKMTRGQLKGYVSISTVDEMQIVEITATTEDAHLSYQIADAFAKVAPQQIVDITKAGGAEVVDRAEENNSPIGPGAVRYSIIGCAAGVLLAAAYFVLRMLSDTTLCTAEDIENSVNVPLLSAIPKVEEKHTGKTRPYTVEIGGVIEYGGSKNKDFEEPKATQTFTR